MRAVLSERQLPELWAGQSLYRRRLPGGVWEKRLCLYGASALAPPEPSSSPPLIEQGKGPRVGALASSKGLSARQRVKRLFSAAGAGVPGILQGRVWRDPLDGARPGRRARRRARLHI